MQVISHRGRRFGATLTISCSSLLLALASACSSGGSSSSPAPPTVDVTGDWTITEEVLSASGACADEIGQVDSYVLTATQDGASLTVVDGEGRTFYGSVSGNKITWTGSYAEDDGITTITGMNVSVVGDGLSGTVDWRWSDGEYNCTGRNYITGSRAGSEALGGSGGILVVHDLPNAPPMSVSAAPGRDPNSSRRLGLVVPGGALWLDLDIGIWRIRLVPLGDDDQYAGTLVADVEVMEGVTQHLLLPLTESSSDH